MNAEPTISPPHAYRHVDMDEVRRAVRKLLNHGTYIVPLTKEPWNRWTPATLFNLDDKSKVGVLEVMRAARKISCRDDDQLIPWPDLPRDVFKDVRLKGARHG